MITAVVNAKLKIIMGRANNPLNKRERVNRAILSKFFTIISFDSVLGR